MAHTHSLSHLSHLSLSLSPNTQNLQLLDLLVDQVDFFGRGAAYAALLQPPRSPRDAADDSLYASIELLNPCFSPVASGVVWGRNRDVV